MPPVTARALPTRAARDGGPTPPVVNSSSNAPAMVRPSSSWDGLASDQSSQRKLKFAYPGSPPIRSSSSAVFCRISASSPRLSTFSRISGSVFDERRLKRQSANSTLTPSV